MVTGSALRQHLDEIWKHPAASHALAARAVTNLATSDLALLAAWDTAASYGPDPGRVVVIPDNPSQFEIKRSDDRLFLVANIDFDSKDDNDGAIIRYTDRAVAVYIDKSSPVTLNDSERHEIARLLVAAQLIRDHADSALLLPRPLRMDRLNKFASLTKCSADRFKMLWIWFSQIERDFGLSLRSF
jgi:hypothetical protein